MIIIGRCSNNNNNNNGIKECQLCLPMSRYCYGFLLYWYHVNSGLNTKSNYCISQNIHFIDIPDWWIFFFVGMVHFVHICMLFSKKTRASENRRVTVIVTMIVYSQTDHWCDCNETASFIIYYSYMEMKCWMVKIHSVAWLSLFFRFWEYWWI